MDYIEVDFKISPIELGREILISELEALPFESFEDTLTGLKAYMPSAQFEKNAIDELAIFSNQLFDISYTSLLIPDQNWNEAWEKNFSPIVVAEQCYIRASFHETLKDVKYEIVIDPKMSFGTGHHQTTAMMVEYMLSLDFKDKNVLDMGCGTGVLAILSSKLGSESVRGIDIDNWSYQNALENVEVNKCQNITIEEGTIEKLKIEEKYDVILANINKNVLLSDIPNYSMHLEKGGILLLSGFYESDKDDILKVSIESGLRYTSELVQKDWQMLALIK